MSPEPRVPLELVDVAPQDPRLVSEVLPVLAELRPHLTADSFLAVYEEGHPQGLRFLAAYDGADDGADEPRCVGVAGWRVVASTSPLRQLYVDDLVVASSARSGGVGSALLDELERRAREAGCSRLALDSGVTRHGAHRFYLRERMDIVSHHFAKAL